MLLTLVYYVLNAMFRRVRKRIWKDDRCFVQSIHTHLGSHQADFYYIL